MNSQKNSPNYNSAIARWIALHFTAIKNYFLPQKVTYPGRDADLGVLLLQSRDRILTIMLRLTSLLGTISILSLMGILLGDQRWDLILTYLVGMILIGVISYLRQINYAVRALTFLAILYLLGVIDLAFFGIAEDWRLYFSSFTILAALFLGWRAGLAALFLSLFSFIVIAWQIATGHIVITASTMVSPIPNTQTIFTFSLVFTLANTVVISAITTLLDEFENAIRKEREVAVQLEQKTAELEYAFSREQKLAREVVFALQREEELNKLRSKIITTISHEFRTPLTVINNSANLLHKYYERLTSIKRTEQFTRIQQSIFYLTELLRDIALVEGTQNNSLHPRREVIQFGQLQQRLLNEIRQETAVPANLEIRVTGNESQKLVLDYQLLKQIIFNLLTNAFKFSPAELPVQLDIACENNLTFTISDQGIGIPDGEKDKIWELFYRGSNVDSYSGLGLGLFIITQLLETMGGSISLEDNLHTGTVFTVTLPLQSPVQPAPVEQ